MTAKLLPLHGGDYYAWKYLPSLPASIIFAVLFFICTVAHTYRLYINRLWFCIPFAVGGLLETIGYAARSASHFHTDQLPPFIIQNLMLLLPPALFAASVYMVLKRTILAVNGAHFSIIPVRWLTRLFVIGDIITFWVQGGGGGMMASDSMASTGEKIVVGGLVLQVLLFGLFCVTAVVFHYRFKTKAVNSGTKIPWERIMWMLYGVSVLIMIRSIFRVVEFAMGQDGYALSHEWTLYVFDTVLMFIVMVVFFVWYPGTLDPRASDMAFSRDIETANTNSNINIHDINGDQWNGGADTDVSQDNRYVQMDALKANQRR